MDHEHQLTPLHVEVILGALTLCCGLLSVVSRRGPAASPLLSPSTLSVPADFHTFQRNYLAVYLLCTFSDWLKGPYVYALYVDYGFNQTEIAWLFAGGFLSSLVFGTIAGSLSDRYGRKLMCTAFCAIYAASAATKVINSFFWLFFGRVLSGIATSLLFTAFESWMVSEHHARQYPEALVANTFSKAIWGNGIVAVLAGVVAQAAASMYGFAAPFLVAIPCLFVAGLLIQSWEENYGNASISPLETFFRGFERVRKERKLLELGLCQALFEGAMYSWVFYWTPCLTSASMERHSAADQVLPFGLMFACYMCAMMTGGAIMDIVPHEAALLPLHLLSVGTMAVGTIFFQSKVVVFMCFVIFECLVGMYFAAHGALRSLHIEESTRSSVMNLFRVPLNAIVLGTITVEVTAAHVMPLLGLYLLLSLVALNAVDVGNVAAACEFYEVALQTSPNNDKVLEAYAEIMVHFVQDAQRAVQMLRHAIDINPNEGFVKYVNLAQLCTGRDALGLYATAYTIAQRDLARARKKSQQKKLRRTLSTIRCAAAELFLTDLCDEPDAETQCEACVDDANFYCNDSVEVHQLRGSLRLSQQRNKEALASLRIAVDLTHRLGEEYQPTYESKVELGKLLMQVDPGDAFRFLLEVLQLDASNPYVWFLLAEASRLRQRFPDSARLFKRARMMVAPSNTEAITEIDQSIALLVSEMGGECAVNAVPHMDAPNPLDYLEPDEDDDLEGGDDDGDEVQWEAASSDSDAETNLK